MKKTLSSFVILVAISLLCTACNEANYADKVIGTWEASIFIDSEKAKSVFDMKDSDGMKMEMTSNLKISYLRGNRYNSGGEVTIRISSNGQEMPLKLEVQESGTWEMHENFIISVSEDAKVTGLDEATRNIIRTNPDFTKAIQPVKGSSSSTEIIEIDNKTMQVKVEDLPGLLISYEKK